MSKILIESVTNGYLITGEILESIDKRMQLHLKRKFQAEFLEHGIFIDSQEKENLISNINNYFSKKGVNLELNDQADKELKTFYRAEEDFREFSQKAKEIWNNDVDTNEFEHFCNHLNTSLIRKLYPLQLLSAYHLAFSQNACNFSVPGAGKTSIVYGAYSFLKSLEENNNKFVDKILVIGPLSSFGPWENEYNECFGKETTVKRISGGNLTTEERKKYFYSNSPSEITLISYQGVLSQKDNLEFFLKNNNVMIILDEAHKIKNTEDGQISEVILKLAPLAKGRVILTGTPAPNGYRDLHNLFKFIWPTKDIMSFSLNQLDDMTKNSNDPRINILIENLSPFFVRIKKQDLGLPDKNEIPPIIVPMDKHQKLIYKKIESKVMKNLLEEISSFEGDLKKASLIRMMQVASNPHLLLKPLKDNYFFDENGNLFETDDEIVNTLLEYEKKQIVPPKFLKCLELIRTIIDKGEKVIVWAIYIDTIEQLSKYLNKNGIESKILYGKTRVESESLNNDIETRESIIRDFHKPDSEFKVVIANPFAVAESISLHRACHNAIYLERNFDAARFVQSKDRIHRYGLEMNTITNYYYLLTEDSVDMIVNERLREKEELMVRVTESAEIPLFGNLDDEFDNNDIKALIEEYARRTT